MTIASSNGLACASASDSGVSSVYWLKLLLDGAVVGSTALGGHGGGRMTCFAASFHVALVVAFSDRCLANSSIMLDTDHRWISDKVHPALPSSAIPSVPKICSYFCHISDTPPFVPVPLVSPFFPMFPVSLISVSMPLWSSCLSHKFSPPHSCLPLFHASTFCS